MRDQSFEMRWQANLSNGISRSSSTQSRTMISIFSPGKEKKVRLVSTQSATDTVWSFQKNHLMSIFGWSLRTSFTAAFFEGRHHL